MTALIVSLTLLIQDPTLLSDSLAIELPEGTQISQTCDSPVLPDIAGVDELPAGSDICLAFNNRQTEDVIAYVHTAFEARGWVIARDEDNARLFANTQPPEGCQQAVMTTIMPAEYASRSRTERARVAEGGRLYMLFMKGYSEGCEF